jgi:hypothetical protein
MKEDFKIFTKKSLYFNGPLQFLCYRHLRFTNSPFLWKTASVDTIQLIISTCCFPKVATVALQI